MGYGNPGSLTAMLRLLGLVVGLSLWPDGRKAYSTGLSFLNREPFMADCATLFTLLRDGSIRPVIAATFPLLEAANANTLYETGQVVGNIVLTTEAHHG